MAEPAIAYLRVSTEEQKKKGLSIELQRKMALSYVAEYNRNVVIVNDSHIDQKVLIELNDNGILMEAKPASKIFSDSIEEELSDSLKNRPVLQHIIELAERKVFKHLIIYSRDRLARNFEQFIAMKYLFKRNGIQIHYSRPGENLNIEDQKINRFIDNILASVAELEANTIGVRVKSGGRICVKKGYWPGGKPPFGYTLESIKVKGRKHNIGKLKPSILEKSDVEEVFKLYANGYSYKEIAELMRKKYNDEIWTKSKVEKIIRNETYTGRITWNRRGGRRHPNEKGEPIKSDTIDELMYIDSEEWKQCIYLRSRKAGLKDTQYFNTEYFLKDKLVCGNCYEKLKTKNYGTSSKGDYQRVYRCASKSNGKSELVLPKEWIEKEILKLLDQHLKSASTDKLYDMFIKEVERQKNIKIEEVKQLESKIIGVERLQRNMDNMLSDIFSNEIKIPDFKVEDTNKDLKKEDEDPGLSIKDVLKEKLSQQDLTFSLLKAKLQAEKDERVLFINRKYINSIEQYDKALKKFKVNFLNFSNRNKRIFIDILVDKIIIEKIDPSNDSDDSLSIRMVLNPGNKL